MRAEVSLAFVMLLVGSAAYPVQASPRPPELKVLVLEEGRSASRYVSQHRLECGNTQFEMTVESPHPVRVTELKIDGKSVPSAQLQAINGLVPERSWFNRIMSSCTSKAQALNLRISTPTGEVAIPLSFAQGVLEPITGVMPVRTP